MLKIKSISNYIRCLLIIPLLSLVSLPITKSLTIKSAFILPQIVREWHPIAIANNIDKSKPYVYNIGKLPMVLWYDNKVPLSTINICKHLGAKLDSGIINDGCLHCSNHFMSYNGTDAIGNVIEKNGLLWWSFKSYTRNPPKIFKDTTKLHQTFIDINVNLINVILEFIYSNNKTKIRQRKNKFFFSEELFNAEHRFYYKYPYYIKGSINNKINYSINFSPLEENKTRLYINIENNVDTKDFFNYYLNNKLDNLKNYDNNNYLKYLIMLKDDNSYMKQIYLLFDKYSFPNDFTISSFYKYRQFY
jgi:nitrite reductase/ring-hydroxylating ferredoxin subunit